MSNAKVVRLSDDNGVTWATLTGNDASVTLDGAELDTTVFGSSFNQSITGIINHSLSGNAMMRKTAGYNAQLKTVGASTPLTDEPMNLVSGKTYKVTDVTKSYLNPSVPATFEDGGVAISAANIQSINYVVGTVTFVAGYTVTGAITVSGAYLPTSNLACAREMSVSQSADTVATGCFNTIAANGGFELFKPTQKSVSLEASDFYRTNSNWYETLLDRDQIVIEIDWDGKGTTVCRGIFRVLSNGLSGGVSDENESVSFVLSADDGVEPFGWVFGAGSEAPESFKKVILAWQNGTELKAQYLPEGVGSKGFEGVYIVTDASVSTSVEGLTEMSVDLQGTGAISPIN